MFDTEVYDQLRIGGYGALEMKVGLLHVIPELQNCGLLPLRFAHTLPTRRFGAGHSLLFGISVYVTIHSPRDRSNPCAPYQRCTELEVQPAPPAKALPSRQAVDRTCEVDSGPSS